MGTFDLSTAGHTPVLAQQWETPVFNVDPGRNAPARFGFNVAGVVVYIEPNVRTGGDYGVTARVKNISQTLASVDSKLTLWGVPAASAHDSRRGAPFSPDTPSHEAPSPLLTMPTSCNGSPLRVEMSTASWEHPDVWDSASFETDFDGNPILNDGCDRLPFDPGLSVEPQPAARAGGPAGLRIELTVPQSESASGLSSAHLKKAVITLPEGMSVNPSSAQGLAGCAPAQVDIHGSGPASCPLASKLGTVQVETPLLDGDLEGGIYLASQGDNPFGSTIATYLVVEGSGVVIKLAGRVETDPHTGRLTITFDDNPQLPFETLAVELKAGPRAPLTMPSNCGPATTTAVLAPWSGTAPATVSSSFEVTGGSDGCDHAGFAPKLNAGSANPVAGSFSPFIVRLTRSEGESELGAIQSLRPPKGLLASLRGVPYCPDSALAGVSGEEGTGAAQIASPACPQASQVGTTTVGAGSGPNPFYTDKGRVYLAGPYKGAPLSLAAVVPAVAGPFDLGSVVVRNALHVDPETAQIEVKSDPLPQILQGIPLDLRDVQVAIDRRDFTLNPTSCDPMEVTSTIASVSGKTASPSSRFQVANCERLAFKPKLSLRLSGAPTRRGGYPKLRAELTMPPGGANIQRAQVLLPKTEFLENAHIRTICTRVQYAAGNGGGAGCPAASIYGYAKAWTPLLDKPVEGPVYLRSSSHKLPDLVASLDGQIHIDLVGRIDAKDARIRNTFETVPDAPVSKFVLTMQGGKKGLLVNNTNLCRAKPRADVRFVGQNGKVADSTPLVRVAECGKKGR
ncbi:MAG TPA: hypothetical protein VHA54_11645 [Solirubrobacterales bacterium]|nr:hypothetical protein [Solirubrobacterales bacterium]